MDLNKVRRVSSAGYRLPERPNATRQMTQSVYVQKPPDKARNTCGNDDSPQCSDNCDPVKQDQVWRDYVRTEMKGVKEWEKNWSFLKNYDQLGQLKPERSLPDHVPLFSDRLPNTTNHTFGSRVATPLGMELIRMDRLLLWTGSHHKCKQDAEMLPC